MSFLLTNGAVQAYDLPKFKPDKKVSKIKQNKPEKGIVLKGDWDDADLFEQKMRAILASGTRLAPDDPARVPGDKNYVFIGFYKDVPFFLDRYSIKVKETASGAKVWEQNIFPINKKISPRNATSTHQKFCLADGKLYNSTKPKDKDNLANIKDEADKVFLQECFNVGYYFAFGEKVPID